MGADDAFEMNTKTLDGVLKALKDNMKKVRVGILGGKTVRNQFHISGGRSVNAKNGMPKGHIEVATNADVGAIHEFGGEKMPQRSFLRMPITEKLQKELENSNAFTEDTLKEVVKQGSFLPWLYDLAALAEKIISDAFDTGGFGKWPKTKTENNTGMTLVDTQQLRNSITSDVK